MPPAPTFGMPRALPLAGLLAPVAGRARQGPSLLG